MQSYRHKIISQSIIREGVLTTVGTWQNGTCTYSPTKLNNETDCGLGLGLSPSWGMDNM